MSPALQCIYIQLKDTLSKNHVIHFKRNPCLWHCGCIKSRPAHTERGALFAERCTNWSGHEPQPSLCFSLHGSACPAHPELSIGGCDCFAGNLFFLSLHTWCFLGATGIVQMIARLHFSMDSFPISHCMVCPLVIFFTTKPWSEYDLFTRKTLKK